MATEYEQSTGLVDIAQTLVGECEELAMLASEGIRIAACFKTKFAGDGDQAEIQPSEPYSDIKKVSPLYRAFIPYDFIVVLDQGHWNVSGRVEQNALVHSALMRIQVHVTESGTKVKLRKPDIVMFSRTLARYGPFRDEFLTLRDILRRGAQRSAEALTPAAEAAEVLSGEEV